MSEPAPVIVARKTMARVELGEAFARALDDELRTANELGTAAPGWTDLQAAAQYARHVCDPGHVSRALAENELATYRPKEAA